jgi:diguanylate cyclase (GGDEF)-like protein
VEGKEYKTRNYVDTEWKEEHELRINGEKIGFLQVGYLEETPRIDDGYFLEEEKAMLLALGEQIERIIEHKKVEEQLKYYATVDTMTGVLNRRTGLAVLEKEMKLMKRKDISLSICFIDADNLKHVNDTFGHEEGDDMIIIITDIIRSSIRKSDTLCRLGGDEFLIILPECKIAMAEEVWSKINQRLDIFNTNEDKPYKITLSHGCEEYDPEEDKRVDQLLSAADEKMYKDKIANKKDIQNDR